MFYDILKSLCKAKGTNVTRLIKEIGLSSGNLSGWKKGIMPKSDTVKKIADYFGVTTDYLLGNENVSESDTKKIRSSKTEERIAKLIDKYGEDAEILVNQFEQLTAENQRKVIDFALFQAQQQRKDTDKTD